MLDASTRIDVLNLLGDLKSRGLGILFITHDLSLGNYISDTTMILRRGAVVEMGATERVFGNPLHPYTKIAARLGAAAAHEVEGRRGRAGRGARRARRRADGLAGSGGQLVEVEDGHFVAPVPTRTSGGGVTSVRPAPATRRRASRGRSARPGRATSLWRSSRNPIIPRDLVPRREQHLQLGRRAVPRRLRRRLPRRRHAPRDEPARGPQRRRHRLGDRPEPIAFEAGRRARRRDQRARSSTPTTRA